MSGALSGLKVLDLSWGISGPMTTMVLADHGADVVKIEPPGGDPFRDQLGYKTWQRGKRSAILDLRTPADLDVFKTLAAHADILVESFEPGTAARLGIDYETLHRLNPRLIYTSITAYGRDNEHAGRPGYDLLVAARTGLNWEHRGWPEGCVLHMSRREDPLPDLEVPYDSVQGPPRPGPMTTASPAPSLGAFYAALVAIDAALVARETTGLGQWVETTLLQGALTAGAAAWQRSENPDVPGHNTWIFSSKAAKGHFECADGRWVHHWVPNPRFIMGASEGDVINSSPDLSVQNDPDRFGTGIEETLVISYYQPLLADRFKKFPAPEWLEAAAIADVPMQEARSPETALADPLLLADGCVRELEDPELGIVRQVGVVIELEKTPSSPGGAAPFAGQHTADIRAEASALAAKPQAAVPPAKPQAAASPAKGAKLSSPLQGIRVLDLGLAIAGPFGTQMLADLGADVIKVNAFHDTYWHKNHISYTANRGKRSICLDLKEPRAMAILHELVATADVVQHNMRYRAAVRLGIDYESLKKIKPDLIYCHTRGHERGPREGLPANDQTGACIAGVQYEDGAMADGGKPFWSLTSFGDTGNGFLSAAGILKALYHRARTGEGQFVSTSIVNAQLLNASYALGRPDGSGFDRPRLDRMQSGMSALNSLYETDEGWIAIVVPNDVAWAALKGLLAAPALESEAFANAQARGVNDKTLRAALAEAFRGRPAAAWRDALDTAGVPAEVSDPGFGQRLHDDPLFRERRWTVGYRQELVGWFEQTGLLFDFSDTPGVIQGPPLIVGEYTRQVLSELGYSEAQIVELAEAKAVGLWAPGQPLIAGPRRFFGLKSAAASPAATSSAAGGQPAENTAL
jgi:crotonobetainyl-CoA:carnitine CoA-transferase CaiB-like acyl-CoA transferase